MELQSQYIALKENHNVRGSRDIFSSPGRAADVLRAARPNFGWIYMRELLQDERPRPLFVLYSR